MRSRTLSILAVVCGLGLGASLALALEASQLTGAWNGTWEGNGDSGTIALTFEASGESVGGAVSVGQSAGDYVAEFTSVTFEGSEFVARYNYTPDTEADIIMTGEVAEEGLGGQWSMVPAGEDETQAFLGGTWKASKAPPATE